MNLFSLKEYFYKQLEHEYSPVELQNNFYLLTEKYLGIDQFKAESNFNVTINEEALQKFENALARLKKDEPIQYILGEIKFLGRPFRVNAHVHVPRQETETMIAWVIADIKRLKTSNTPLSLLDIGTGCGILPITLFKEVPQLNVTAMDISEQALNVARENAALNQAKINFIQADMLKIHQLPDKFDILVSNPPYVRQLAKQDVQRKILDYEPAVALYVKDKDPMIFNRKIAELAKKNLSENGLVYVEINQYLATESARVFQENGFKTELRKDVFGNIRTLKAFQ